MRSKPSRKRSVVLGSIGICRSRATPGTAPPIGLALVALQLRSVEPVNLGGGLIFHRDARMVG